MPHTEVESLQAELSTGLLSCLKAVHGHNRAAARLASLVQEPPEDLGSELTSSVAVINMFTSVFNLMTRYHTPSIMVKPSAVQSESQADISSQLVGAKLRPDELFVWHMCTMMLCEDQVSSR